MAPPVGLRTWVEISRSALHANVRALQSLLNTTVSLCAFVKSNAYGHDIALTARLLHEAEVTHFGVDSLDEALVVRKICPDAAIFITGMVPSERLNEVITNQFVLDIYEEEFLLTMIDAASAAQKIALVNIEIESGLHRLGVMPRQTTSLLRIIKNAPRNVKLVGVSTHLSSAESVQGQPFVNAQNKALQDIVELCRTLGLEVPFIHIANSAATILSPHVHGTMVRPGIALYGLWPSQEMKLTVQRGRAFELQPVLTWKTRVAQVKDVPGGGAIGYDRTFIANRPMRIAILPVGYWDGYDRGLSNCGKVLIYGRPCPVVGRVCMNMLMVDVSAIPQVKPNDVATLLGREGMSAVTADEIAEKLDTIHYEVVTRIGAHIPRIVV